MKRFLWAAAFAAPWLAAGAAPKPAEGRIPALAVANRYLEAWRLRQGEVGLKLLSPRLRRSISRDDLLAEIVGLSNPHHAAYEVWGGRRVGRRGFAFSVRLYEDYTGHPMSGSPPPPSRIVLVETAGGDWQVDRLPR